MRRIILKHPREAWLGAANIRRQWQALGYTAEPDLERACAFANAAAALSVTRFGAQASIPSRAEVDRFLR